MLLSGGDSGGTVAGTVSVGGAFSARVSAVQHYRLCWSDFRCEANPCMHQYLVAFNHLCVALCNYLFLFLSNFVCLYFSVISFSIPCNDPWDSHGSLLPGSSSLLVYSLVEGTVGTDTFSQNNAKPMSRICEGALCSVTHEPRRPKMEDCWSRKYPQNDALFHCNLNSQQEVRFHHDIKFLLLFGNF